MKQRIVGIIGGIVPAAFFGIALFDYKYALRDFAWPIILISLLWIVQIIPKNNNHKSINLLYSWALSFVFAATVLPELVNYFFFNQRNLLSLLGLFPLLTSILAIFLVVKIDEQPHEAIGI